MKNRPLQHFYSKANCIFNLQTSFLMSEDQQGFGNYTYECRKQGCWHCEMMGLKPLPEIFIPSIMTSFTYKNVVIIPDEKRHNQSWRGVEMKVIRDHIINGTEVVCSLLSHRSKGSVLTRISRMRRDGVI